MLGYNTSLKVVEELFRIETYISFGKNAGEIQSVFDLFSFWIILPKGTCTCNKCKNKHLVINTTLEISLQ